MLLARQPLATVRPAYAALAACGALAVACSPPLASRRRPGLRAAGLAATALGLVALSGLRLGRCPPPALAAAAAVAAGLAIDLPPGPGRLPSPRSAAPLGIALLGAAGLGRRRPRQRRLGPVAGAVAGSWIAAIGLMAAALPA